MASRQQVRYKYGKGVLRSPSSRMVFMTWKWQCSSAPPPHLHHLSLCHLKASQNITQRNDNQTSKDVVFTVALTKKHEPWGEKKLLNSWEMTPFLTSPADSLPMGITLRFSTNHESKEWSHTGERDSRGPTVTMVMQAHHSHLLSSLGPPCLNSSQQDCFSTDCNSITAQKQEKPLPLLFSWCYALNGFYTAWGT